MKFTRYIGKSRPGEGAQITVSKYKETNSEVRKLRPYKLTTLNVENIDFWVKY